MQQLLSSFIFMLFSISSLLAQTSTMSEPFGSYVDLDGQILENYIDQDYFSKHTILVVHNSPITSLRTSRTYTAGAYYLHDGIKKKGEILYGSKNLNTISYKAFNKDKKVNIDLKEIKAFKTGTDSFVVASNFTFYGQSRFISRMPYARPLKHLATTERFSFFEYQSIGKGILSYLIYNNSSQEFIALPHTNKLIPEKLPDLFQDYPELLAILKQKETLPDHIGYLIRFIEYTDAAKTKKHIGYTASWKITREVNKQKYFAKVSQHIDYWKLNFYNISEQKIFTEHYPIAQPGLIHGDIIWYHRDTGKIRKKKNYKEGIPDKEYSLHHSNGIPHYRVEITETDKHIFQQVFSLEGRGLLDEHGNGQEEYFDEVMKRTIIREYEKHKLVASYYTDHQNRKIFQYVKTNASINNLKSSLNTQKYPESALAAEEEGIVMISFIISPDGKVMR
ncbi:MAG: energy transducer TonB, partial [Bacteroidetes bacterium]|nr:energy transducer TonB [Bacteroidota bacterium]